MRQTVVLHPSPTYVGQVGAHKCHIKHARTLKWAPVFKYITTHGLSIKHGELQSVISRRDPPPPNSNMLAKHILLLVGPTIIMVVYGIGSAPNNHTHVTWNERRDQEKEKEKMVHYRRASRMF